MEKPKFSETRVPCGLIFITDIDTFHEEVKRMEDNPKIKLIYQKHDAGKLYIVDSEEYHELYPKDTTPSTKQIRERISKQEEEK